MGEGAKEVRWKRARKAFQNMKTRCYSPCHHGFKRYGARGIEVRFKSAKEIVDHIGLPPPGHTIDRVDVDGHYERGNVRWADRVTQQNNRRDSENYGRRVLDPEKVLRIVELYKTTKITQLRLAEIFGVSETAINYILKGKRWGHVTGIVYSGKLVPSD